MTRRTPIQLQKQRQKEQKGNENGNNNDGDESRNNNNWYQNCFHKSSPYYNTFKPSGKNKAKCYFRYSLQCSVPMVPLSSEYFSYSFLFIKGLMGQFCQCNRESYGVPPQKNAQKDVVAYMCHRLDIQKHCSCNCSVCT